MKILYCRIGWMNSYRGNSTEKPTGGGTYNIDNIGHEVHNYLGHEGNYYGFVEAGVNNSIHVEKLCGDKKAQYADNILAVWIARKPSGGGQYIVGWYEDATVYRVLQTVPDDAMNYRSLKDHNIYNVFSKRVFLIEAENRNFKIEGMGHSNIWYGDPETDAKVLSFVHNFAKDYEDRIAVIDDAKPNYVGEERAAVVKVRINQDKFRDNLIKKFNGKCCLCGVDCKSMLIASHIKPWSKSDEHEKLDIENGLLLCPNHDKLFDSGLISFSADGDIMISKSLSTNNRVFLNVRTDMKIVLSENNADYMKYHRDNVFVDDKNDND